MMTNIDPKAILAAAALILCVCASFRPALAGGMLLLERHDQAQQQRDLANAAMLLQADK